ncbi:MAG: hypothetical protein M3174_06510, partial [Actinomycetota bacterium]|nr:hypothetical protein [Actinomycetota bacterium]
CGSIRLRWDGQVLRQARTGLGTVRLDSTRRKQALVVFEAFGAVEQGAVALEVVSDGKPVLVDGFGVSKT